MSTTTTTTSASPDPPAARKIVEVDNRGRLSVGKLINPGQFVATPGADGSLLLEPAVVTTALEASLQANGELHKEILGRLERRNDAPPARRR